MPCYLFKGPNNTAEERADYNNTETDIIVPVPCSQEDTDCEETLDTTWAEALPFVPGQGYHGDGKFL